MNLDKKAYINNFYYKNTPKQFLQFLDFLSTHRTYLAELKKEKNSVLLEWINSSIPLLKDSFYSLPTKIYWLLNNVIDFPVCDNTANGIHKLINKNVISVQLGYKHHKNSHCCYCSNKCKYSDPKFQKQISDKQKQDLQDKNKKMLKFEKTKNTMLERYGVEHFTNIEKRQQTCLKRYGATSALKNKQVQEKIKNTILKKYGTTNPFANAEVKKKIKQTNLKKYNVDNPSKSQAIQEKTAKTCLKKYGARSISYTYIYDNRSFDSGYEVAYYIWLKDHCINFTYPSAIAFDYCTDDGKVHKYHPDFLVDSIPIEIKGKQFLEDGRLVNPYVKQNTDKHYCDSKFKCMKDNNVIVLTEVELEPIFKYIEEKYKCKTYLDYIKQFKRNKSNVMQK